MQRVSIARRLGKRWMLLVAVGVLAVAGFAVYRLHGIFASHNVTATPDNSNSIAPLDPKHVVLEVVDAAKDERSVDTVNAYPYCLDKSG